MNSILQILKQLLQLFFGKENKPPVTSPPIIETPEQQEQTMKIIQIENFTNYVNQDTIKTKIVLHGTYGGTATGAIQWMRGGSGKNVSVHFVISENGEIYQLFPESKFSYHAGGNFRTISQTSFGIEIVNFLCVDKKGSEFYSWTKKKIPSCDIVETKEWRGHKYFHKVTPEQHKALKFLVNYLCQKYDIDKKFYKEPCDGINYNTKQFSGVLQHSSFHPTKMDFEPTILDDNIV